MNALTLNVLASTGFSLNDVVVASHHWDGRDGAWFPFFPIVPLVFFSLWVVVFLTVGRWWRHPHRLSGESVLAERYARGEIDEVEYRQRREVLRKKG